MTQELNPPAGQEPKIGKLYYKPDINGVRDFEIIEQNPEIKITEKTTQKKRKGPKKTTTKKRETKNNIDIYSIENNDTSSTKIIFNKKDLKNILPLLKIITPKNTYTFPVIFNVIDNKNCEILAQNEKITVKHIIPCNANKIIQLIIDIKNLNSIIKDLSDNILTFEILEKNKLTVNNKLSFETLPTDEFTFEFKNISGNKYNNLNFNLFADNIIKLSPFIDKKNELRANLISICLKYNKESNTIDLISTESHTLGVIAIPIKNLPITETKEMTIPSETVEIIKIINKNIKNDTNFNLIIQSEPNEPYANKMQINSNNFAVISNLIEAEYVNYPAVIPDKNKALIEYKVNSQELLRVVNECDKLVKSPYGLIKFHFKDNSLKITETNDTNLNSYSNEIQVNLIKPNKELNNEFTLGINIKLLNICLKLFNEPTLSLYDKRSAILITEENNPAYSILMPSTID